MSVEFTDKALKVVVQARNEASGLGSRYVGSEHLLMAMLKQESNPATSLLNYFGILQEAAFAALQPKMMRGNAGLDDELLMTSNAQHVLNLALQEAQRLGHRSVSTHHLLIGLLDDDSWIVQQTLRELGLEIEAARAAVRQNAISTIEEADAGNSVSNANGDSPLHRLLNGNSNYDAPDISPHLMLHEATRKGASEILVEPRARGAVVRFRIDGVLSEAMIVPDPIRYRLADQIRTLAEMSHDEQRTLQTGLISVRSTDNNDYELRVTSLPTMNGQAILIRVQAESKQAKFDLNALGLLDADRTVLDRWIARQGGLILLTGQNGTMLAYSLMTQVATPETHVASIEATVEDIVANTTQLALDPATGLTFDAAIAAVSSFHVELLYLGDVLRVSENLPSCLDLASEGRLVIASFPGRTPAKATRRIYDDARSPRLLEDVLIGVAGTRSVRRLCDACKRPAHGPLSDESRALSAAGGFIIPGDATFFESVGCVACRNTGYQGQINLFELIEWHSDLAQSLRAGASADDMTKIAVARGTTTFFADGIRKAALGLTTEAEVRQQIVMLG